MPVVTGNYMIPLTIEYVRSRLDCKIIERGWLTVFPYVERNGQTNGAVTYIGKVGANESNPAEWTAIRWTGAETKEQVIKRLDDACKELS